jgi:hypothetical protein
VGSGELAIFEGLNTREIKIRWLLFAAGIETASWATTCDFAIGGVSWQFGSAAEVIVAKAQRAAPLTVSAVPVPARNVGFALAARKGYVGQRRSALRL